MSAQHGDGDTQGPASAPATWLTIELAGQAMIGDATIVVHRTLEDERSAYAVLRVSHGSLPEPVDITARPSQVIEVPGIGATLVVDVRASTGRQRGAVALARR